MREAFDSVVNAYDSDWVSPQARAKISELTWNLVSELYTGKSWGKDRKVTFASAWDG